MKTTVDDELYELAMIDAQIAEIDRLNKALQQCGISDMALRKRICVAFVSSNGWFLDQGWLESEDYGRVWPELLFARRSLEPGVGLGPIDELVVPEYGSNFDEYLQSSIDHYFHENGESLRGFRTGDA